jgi:hypothetical protein
MKVLARESGFNTAGASAWYFGKMTQRGRARSLALASALAGGRTWQTVPLSVSNQLAACRIDHSQFVRQQPPTPEGEPGTQRTFPRTRGRRHDHGQTIAFKHRAVHRHVLITQVIDAPVQAPFQQREALRAGQRRERLDAVKSEYNLRLKPATQPERAVNTHVEIGEFVIGQQGVLAIVQSNALSNRRQVRPDARHQRPGAHTQAFTSQTAAQVGSREVRDDHDARGC